MTKGQMAVGNNRRLRGLIKTGLSYGLHWTGTDKLIGTLAGSRNMPLVIGYHRVVEDLPANGGNGVPRMIISRRTLERQLDWIGRRYHFISPDELGEKLECGKKFDKPVAVITFDDGYSDFYYNAFPLLRRKGIPAGVFVVTDLIGTPRLQIHDKLYLLLEHAFSLWGSPPYALAPLLAVLERVWQPKMGRISSVVKNPYMALRMLFQVLPQAGLRCIMEALENELKLNESRLESLYSLSWEMVTEIHRAGITIGSHTKTHAILTNESQPKVLEELTDSRQQLEKRLGVAIRHFAHPNGQFDTKTLSAAAASGYRFGYTTCQHRNPRYPLLTIPRHVLWETSGMDVFGQFSSSIMNCHVNGVFTLVDPCRKDHGT